MYIIPRWQRRTNSTNRTRANAEIRAAGAGRAHARRGCDLGRWRGARCRGGRVLLGYRKRLPPRRGCVDLRCGSAEPVNRAPRLRTGWNGHAKEAQRSGRPELDAHDGSAGPYGHEVHPGVVAAHADAPGAGNPDTALRDSAQGAPPVGFNRHAAHRRQRHAHVAPARGCLFHARQVYDQVITVDEQPCHRSAPPSHPRSGGSGCRAGVVSPSHAVGVTTGHWGQGMDAVRGSSSVVASDDDGEHVVAPLLALLSPRPGRRRSMGLASEGGPSCNPEPRMTTAGCTRVPRHKPRGSATSRASPAPRNSTQTCPGPNHLKRRVSGRTTSRRKPEHEDDRLAGLGPLDIDVPAHHKRRPPTGNPGGGRECHCFETQRLPL